LKRGGRTSSAAAIAGLLGGQSPDTVERVAASKFRGISLELVTEQAMASNVPDPELSALTKPAKFNGVDAFLTHSWSDDPKLKWEKLQQWRAAFVAEHGREPIVWIDKYGIDQRNIGDSLLCLPVFLASCRSLVVLAGETYTQRLWCVMEIFTYMMMGGSTDQITVMLLASTPDGQQELVETFKGFNARDAKCFLQVDTDRLLSTIEGGFGNLDEFSNSIGSVLEEMASSTQIMGEP
jgi:hypothetical protein